MIAATLTCPRCGGDLATVTVGEPFAGTCATTVVECPPCRQQYSIIATLRPLGPRRPAAWPQRTVEHAHAALATT